MVQICNSARNDTGFKDYFFHWTSSSSIQYNLYTYTCAKSGRPAARIVLGLPKKLHLPLNLEIIFLSQEMDKFMQTALWFSNFDPIFCASLISNGGLGIELHDRWLSFLCLSHLLRDYS